MVDRLAGSFVLQRHRVHCVVHEVTEYQSPVTNDTYSSWKERESVSFVL